MVYKNFHDLVDGWENTRVRKVAVAVAEDEEVLIMAEKLENEGLAKFILVGDEVGIELLKELHNIKNDFQIINCIDPVECCEKAIELVKNGEADVLMKGQVNSSLFLKAVVSKEKGLAHGKLLSHMGVFSVPTYHKLIFQTDGGMNTFPNLDEKKLILENALGALKKLGINNPKVGVICANEVVNPKMPNTLEAQIIARDTKGCIIEGPIAFDVAISSEAAKHKGIESKVSGDTDLFLMPDIEVGNVAGKTLIHCAKAQMAGVVLGGDAPIVMTSRAENAEGKIISLLLACMIS